MIWRRFVWLVWDWMLVAVICLIGSAVHDWVVLSILLLFVSACHQWCFCYHLYFDLFCKSAVYFWIWSGAGFARYRLDSDLTWWELSFVFGFFCKACVVGCSLKGQWMVLLVFFMIIRKNYLLGDDFFYWTLNMYSGRRVCSRSSR